MAETLKAETGRPTGSGPAKRLRAAGKVPGVVYGLDNEPVPVSVDWRELRGVLTTDAGLNVLIDLEVDGTTKLAIVKEMQRHPIQGTVRHVDFLLIRADTAISVDVPIVLEGEATQILGDNGMVDQALTLLTVSAKPADIPNEIVVDVSGLQFGEPIRVGDLSLPSGVTTDADPEEPVVTAQHVRAEAPAEGEGGEGEGAEGEGAEGAASGGDAAEGGDEG